MTITPEIEGRIVAGLRQTENARSGKGDWKTDDHPGRSAPETVRVRLVEPDGRWHDGEAYVSKYALSVIGCEHGIFIFDTWLRDAHVEMAVYRRATESDLGKTYNDHPDADCSYLVLYAGGAGEDARAGEEG